MPAEPDIVTWFRDLRSTEAIYVSDSRQRIVAWSPAAERLTGYSAEDVIGRPCYEVIAGTEPDGHPVCRRNCSVVRNARRGRPTTTYEVTARRKDGDRVCLESSIVVAADGQRSRPYMLHLVRPAETPADSPAAVPPAPHLAGTVDAANVPPVGQPLSRRELEVLRLLAAGRSTAEVAEILSISRFTARNHIGNLERKLGARTRVEVILFGAHHHLI